MRFFFFAPKSPTAMLQNSVSGTQCINALKKNHGFLNQSQVIKTYCEYIYSAFKTFQLVASSIYPPSFLNSKRLILGQVLSDCYLSALIVSTIGMGRWRFPGASNECYTVLLVTLTINSNQEKYIKFSTKRKHQGCVG